MFLSFISLKHLTNVLLQNSNISFSDLSNNLCVSMSISVAALVFSIHINPPSFNSTFGCKIAIN